MQIRGLVKNGNAYSCDKLTPREYGFAAASPRKAVECINPHSTWLVGEVKPRGTVV